MYQAIIQVLRYYAFFSYPPTEDELYVFLPRKTSRAHFHTALESLVKKDILLHKNIEGTVRYQILRNEQIFDIYTLKQKRGQTQYMKAQSILKYFHCIPTLKYLGISGSLSMLNIGNKSDIDIFVITAPAAIWQTRFMLLVFKRIMTVFSPSISIKLCFNLFFAENGLGLRFEKRTRYIGHEILQLKTIINKDQTYETLVAENGWIVKYFPNVHINLVNQKPASRKSEKSDLLTYIEEVTKKIQTWWLQRKHIHFNDFGAQVWLIQEDFEKKIKADLSAEAPMKDRGAGGGGGIRTRASRFNGTEV